MRPGVLITAILALVPQVLTDQVFIDNYWFLGSGHAMYFQTNFGTWQVNYVPQNCQYNPGPPDLTDLCMDVNQKRGHFKFSHQNYKRCLVKTSEDWQDCGTGSSCSTHYYTETGCTWRLGLDGSDLTANETISAISAQGSATATFPRATALSTLPNFKERMHAALPKIKGRVPTPAAEIAEGV